MDFSSYYYYIPLNFYETPEMTLIDHEPNGDSATVLVLALAKIHTRTVTKNDDGTFTIVTDDGTFTGTEVMEMLSSFGYRANHAKYTHALAVVARFPPFDHLAYSEAERDKKTPAVYQCSSEERGAGTTVSSSTRRKPYSSTRWTMRTPFTPSSPVYNRLR